MRARCCFCVFALDLRDVYASFVSILMRIFPFFHNFAIFLFLGNCNFYAAGSSDFVITGVITDRTGLHSVLLPLLIVIVIVKVIVIIIVIDIIDI